MDFEIVKPLLETSILGGILVILVVGGFRAVGSLVRELRDMSTQLTAHTKTIESILYEVREHRRTGNGHD